MAVRDAALIKPRCVNKTQEFQQAQRSLQSQSRRVSSASPGASLWITDKNVLPLPVKSTALDIIAEM